MGVTYTVCIAEVDEFLRLGREANRSLMEGDTQFSGYTVDALEAYERLEPAPTVHPGSASGVPPFWENLRHFVGGRHTFYLHGDWVGWFQNEVTDIFGTSSRCQNLWRKLLGSSEEEYRMEIEGTEYAFEDCNFLFGEEVSTLGECIESHEEALKQSCPTDSLIQHDPRDRETTRDAISGDEFVSQLRRLCRGSEGSSLLWYN